MRACGQRTQKKASSDGQQAALHRNQEGNENRQSLNSIGVWKYYLLSEGNKDSVPSSHIEGRPWGQGEEGGGAAGATL